MGRIPIALQLYSVRENCANDLPGTLEAVAKMGYEGVDFAGYHDRSAAELRKMLDDLGLKMAGTHIGLDTLLGDALEATIEFEATLGNKFLIVPGLPEERRCCRDAWLETAAIFNDIAANLERHGMKTGYHNHAIEFTPMDGEMPWDTLGSNTNDDVVLQIDLGNALHGGADPVPFIEKYPGRSGTVHLKEYSATNDKALIGEGDVRWDETFRLCESIGGTEWYIVEQESYAYPPMECVEKCLQALKEMGK
ncbi:MAG: sugar phosphate isomerase/epimerase [Candidatus Brocadiaceae bacterium]|jgi:sugar phosphate isomerase/epimerase